MASFYHLIRHPVYLGVALGLAGLTFSTHQSMGKAGVGIISSSSLVLLALVLVQPGIGREVNAACWLKVGPISMQASEIAKLFMLIYLAGYFGAPFPGSA